MKEQALKEGKEEGLAEGRNIERQSNARKMLDKGYPIEDIVEITGLTIDEIKGL